MRNMTTAAAALLATTIVASAGGIERGNTPFSVLYEDGDYLELGFTVVQPNVSGDYPALLGGISTGNMANDEFLPSFAYKNQLTDTIALGLFFNAPFGADAEYSGGVYDGLRAEWQSRSTTAVLKYDINPNFSAFGGLRYTTSSADIFIPAFVATGGATSDPSRDYTAVGESDGQVSTVAGVAYERPEIALRVALTYEEGFTHKFDTTEEWLLLGLAALPSPLVDVTRVDMPQAITLDFQTGIAQDTLLFGSVRHVEWSVWEVRPTGFDAVTGFDVVSFDNDTTTYNLGIGRRLNDQLSVFGRMSYEESKGGVASRLAPTDGSTSLALGGSYRVNDMKLTGGLQYTWVGDATDGSGVEFTDNTALSIGGSIGYYF